MNYSLFLNIFYFLFAAEVRIKIVKKGQFLLIVYDHLSFDIKIDT